MTVAEACTILGLKPGRRYSREQILEAVQKTDQRTQPSFYHPTGGVRQQEDAIRTMKRVKQAAAVLLSRAKSGPVQVPRTASPRSATTGYNPLKKLLVGFFCLPFTLLIVLARALVGTVSSPRKRKQIWQGIVQAARVSWSIVRALWLFSCWPFRLLLRRRVWGAMAALLLVGLVLAFCFVFVTGGLREIGTTVKRATFSINQFLTTILGSARGLPRMHSSFRMPIFPAILGSIHIHSNILSED